MEKLELLEEVIADQAKMFLNKDVGILRDVDFEKYLKTDQITVISGIRRSGKSTLLAQFSRKCKNGFYYANFDDERLIHFTVEDFRTLLVAFQKTGKAKTIFLDEVQNVVGWERFVRRLHDEGYKIFITGSNARLLSSELGTHLTGRYGKIELYPFSFREFLLFSKKPEHAKTSEEKAEILKSFDEYVSVGGFPEFLKYRDAEYLKRIYEDILYRDLLVRFKIKETKPFRELASYLFSNFTKEISYNSLKNTLGFKSVTSVKNYLEFMRESFLLFEIQKYDPSLKKQFLSKKKIYAIDNGLRSAIAFSFSEDTGRYAENVVFLELKRRGEEIYFYQGKKECDFIVKQKTKITTAIGVCSSLHSENEEREKAGIAEAMKVFHLKEGWLLNNFEERDIIVSEGIIHVVPLWKWFLKEQTSLSSS
jgi:hypothetical protein